MNPDNSSIVEKIHQEVNCFLQSQLSLNVEKSASRKQQLVLGYSGGLDSSVLLQVMYNLQTIWQSDFELLAVHVNHGLQKEADEWQEHCQTTAGKLGVNFISKTVKINKNSSDSLEELARNARYDVFQSIMKPGDVLCLAHHLEDQGETFILRLLRGSGPLGLASMDAKSIRGENVFLRPLLNISKEFLKEYAQIESLEWIEDSSNFDIAYDRNYLRHNIMPALEERWPSVAKRLSRSAELNSEAASLLDALAEIDMASISKVIENPVLTKNRILDISGLKSLENKRQMNVLRYWLRSFGMPLPSRIKLQQIADEVLEAGDDRTPCVCWQGSEVRRFKNDLYLMEPLPPTTGSKILDWDLQKNLKLPDGLGELVCTEDNGKGSGLRYPNKDEKVTVRFRQGGERCKPLGRSASQTLKKLFQEYDIPPWERDLIPVIYYNDQLAAVTGKWVCEGFEVINGQKALHPCWRS